MTQHSGIMLTRNGRSWVSVANPHRHAAYEMNNRVLDREQLHARGGGAGACAGIVIGCIALIAGAPIAVSAIVALLAIAGTWFAVYRWFGARGDAARQQLEAREQSFGPSKLMRGHLVTADLAEMGDQLVESSVTVLRSDACRDGLLGHPQDVYSDVMDSTWAVLWRLVQLDKDTRNLNRQMSRLAQHTSPGELTTEVDYLEQEQHAAKSELFHLVLRQLELAETVSALDEQASIPQAREKLVALSRSRVADLSPQDGADNLTARIDAAKDIIDIHNRATDDTSESQETQGR